MAKKAVEKMHRYEYKGREIVVKKDLDTERDKHGKPVSVDTDTDTDTDTENDVVMKPQETTQNHMKPHKTKQNHEKPRKTTQNKSHRGNDKLFFFLFYQTFLIFYNKFLSIWTDS